jgi:hypothetical protein
MKYLKIFENFNEKFENEFEYQLEHHDFKKEYSNSCGSSLDTWVTSAHWPGDATKDERFEVENTPLNNRTKNMIYALESWYHCGGHCIAEDYDYLENMIKKTINMDDYIKKAREYIEDELVKEIEKDPSLYVQYKKYFDEKLNKKLPDWVRRGNNTGLLNTEIKDE